MGVVLDASAAGIVRSARRTHAVITIPLHGDPTGLRDVEILGRARDTVTASESLPRCKALLLEFAGGQVIVSVGGPAPALDFWLDDLRIADAIQAAIDASPSPLDAR